MEKTGTKKRFGLVGKNIGYSFSPGYFKAKFEAEGLKGYTYVNFDLQEITQFPSLLEHYPDLAGLNVTIPYKEAVIPYLDGLSEEARKIGAVNTIAFREQGITGFNTDAHGFRASLLPHLHNRIVHALVLGTGGASKAITHVLEGLGMPYFLVSRDPKDGQLTYDTLEHYMEQPSLVVNCTPLGTYPDVEARPPLPYHLAGKDHIFYDLVYNPPKTAFLKSGEKQGAGIINGAEMLRLQAEKAWEIWNS